MPFLNVSPELECYTDLFAYKRGLKPQCPYRDLVEPKVDVRRKPWGAKPGSEEEAKWQAEVAAAKDKHEKTVLMYATDVTVTQAGGGKLKHNYLIDAFHWAYNQHGVVVLTPNVVLSALQSVVATTVCHHAEAMRHLFVEHEDKKDIVVALSAPIGQYSLPQFMELVTRELKKDLKVDYPLSDEGLSTSTPDTHLANVVQTMATFKEYYRYGGICECGFRGIKLEGTPEDWVALDAKLKATQALFATLGDKNPLARWFQLTQKVMDRFVRMAALPDGSQLPPDLVRFVNSSFVKCPQGSGGDYFVSGWLGTTLAPIFSEEGVVVTVNGEGERSFFDSDAPVPDWNDDEYKELGCYQKQDVFMKKVSEWSGGLIQHPAHYAASSNQVPFELNDNGFVSDIDLVAGIGGVSVTPSPELDHLSFMVEDMYTRTLKAVDGDRNPDGSWKIPDGWKHNNEYAQYHGEYRICKAYKRKVHYNEFRPQVVVRMIATLKMEPDVTAGFETAGQAMRKDPARLDAYVQEWKKAYTRAAEFHRSQSIHANP